MKELIIRNFEFPSFEEWFINKQETQTFQIGDYYAEISNGGFGKHQGRPYSDYSIALSVDTNPTHCYARKIFRRNIEWFVDEPEVLKEWYETSVKELQIIFKKRINDLYISNDIEFEEKNANNN